MLVGTQDSCAEHSSSRLCLGLLILCVATQEMSNREWRQTHDEAFLGIDVHFFFFLLFPAPPPIAYLLCDPEDLVNSSRGDKLLEAAQTRPEAN